MTKETTQAEAFEAAAKQKVFNSAAYVRKIKRMTEMLKRFQGINRIPNRLPPLKASSNEVERQNRAKIENFRLTKDTVHYWANSVYASTVRTGQAPSNVDKNVKDMENFLQTPQVM